MLVYLLRRHSRYQLAKPSLFPHRITLYTPTSISDSPTDSRERRRASGPTLHHPRCHPRSRTSSCLPAFPNLTRSCARRPKSPNHRDAIHHIAVWRPANHKQTASRPQQTFHRAHPCQTASQLPQEPNSFPAQQHQHNSPRAPPTLDPAIRASSSSFSPLKASLPMSNASLSSSSISRTDIPRPSLTTRSTSLATPTSRKPVLNHPPPQEPQLWPQAMLPSPLTA